jgi:hypothetical protein
MKIFKRKSKTTKELTKVQRRVNSLPTQELLNWTDQIMYSVGRNLSAWQKTQYKDNLAEARLGAESLNDDQNRVGKFMRAARSAGAYKQRASIDEPMIRGRTPRVPAAINGVALPTTGDSGGRTGAVGYAGKPQPRSGMSYSWLDSFG